MPLDSYRNLKISWISWKLLEIQPLISPSDRSLIAITQKIVEFKWGPKQVEVFETLNEKLSGTQVLALPEGNDDLMVYSDVSK